MANIFFTSDTHFGHANIIKYCNRPFANAAEMDDQMIKRWNSKVAHGDTIYHIGDFSLVKDASQIQNYVRALNGQIHLILGNHDQKRVQFLKGFADVKPYKEIKIGDQKIIMCHYAFKTWNGSHRGSWNLHGHSHGTLPKDMNAKQIDVGVDCWNFTPISYDEVADEMKKHVFVPIDHHKEREEM